MAPRCRWTALALLVLTPAAVRCAPPGLPRPNPSGLLKALSTTSFDSLAGALRGYVVHNLPPVLYDASPGWGNTKLVGRVEWRGKGLGVHPEKVYTLKNDGHWRKARVVAANLPDTLILDLRNVRTEQPGAVRFDLFLSFDARIDYVHQHWESGLKLYDGSVRARMRCKALLSCEATARLDDSGGLLPDAVFRLRVTRAQLNYDNLVVEHVGGVGGELANLLGEAVKGSLKRFAPDLERDLLAKAEAAVVKAGDTKEVRLSLSKLLKNKP